MDDDEEDLDCGEILCLRCGDCYHCYKYTLCYDGNNHCFALSYIGEVDTFIKDEE